jgi:hypothetical protein
MTVATTTPMMMAIQAFLWPEGVFDNFARQ